jgi:hypothetical protein
MRAGGYPYTPPVGLIAGLAHAIEMLEDEGLENVYARHHRLAEGVRRAVAGWGMAPCAASADLYSDTVTAVKVPEGCNGTDLVQLAARNTASPSASGLGEVAGKVFRIGHLGMLTDAMVLSGWPRPRCAWPIWAGRCGWARAWRRRRSIIAARCRHGLAAEWTQRGDAGAGGQPPRPPGYLSR